MIRIIFFVGIFNQSVLAKGLALNIHNSVIIALKNNTQIIFAQKQLNLQKKMEKIAIRNFLPSLTLSYLNNKSRTPLSFDSRVEDIKLSATQPIWDGGKKQLEVQI